MSKGNVFRPASLTQYFEAPDDYRGEFGWLCGYSADEWFMDRAAERFTRETRAQRGFTGRIALALILNPEHPQLSPTEVPGVLHLPLRSAGDRPFRLMHAKVAILGFRHVSDARQWMLRLVVSTGNWTRETSEESLDIAWSTEIGPADLSGASLSQRLSLADMAAASDLFRWLRGRFDTRALSIARADGGLSLTTAALNQVDAWCADVRAPLDVMPRFFDNRQASLLAQLPTQIRATGRTSASRTLAMGSGFYEGGPGAGLPSVPLQIVQALQGAGDGHRLLTRTAEIHLFVNPEACQSIATNVDAIAGAGWTLRSPGRPAYFGERSRRMMHAKFLLGAGMSTREEHCGAAWIYLGSGNLTGPGFTSRMGHGGNLEAGVVHAVQGLQWGPVREAPALSLGNLLPVQWERTVSADDPSLSAGGEMPEPDATFVAPPVPWLLWTPAPDTPLRQPGAPGGLLPPDEAGPSAFQVLDPMGQPCPKTADGAFLWPDSRRPRQVLVGWDGEGVRRQAFVPVLDVFSRFAGTELAALDIDTAWDQLDSFPLPPDEEELTEPGEPPPLVPFRDLQPPARGKQAPSHYPIRQLMKLVENIAAKQTDVPQADWNAWCVRFAQTMQQTASSPELASFRALGLNPLSPLWHAPFRPGFAESSTTPEGVLYESVLREIEDAWRVAGLSPLGELE